MIDISCKFNLLSWCSMYMLRHSFVSLTKEWRGIYILHQLNWCHKQIQNVASNMHIVSCSTSFIPFKNLWEWSKSGVVNRCECFMENKNMLKPFCAVNLILVLIKKEAYNNRWNVFMYCSSMIRLGLLCKWQFSRHPCWFSFKDIYSRKN